MHFCGSEIPGNEKANNSIRLHASACMLMNVWIEEMNIFVGVPEVTVEKSPDALMFYHGLGWLAVVPLVIAG